MLNAGFLVAAATALAACGNSSVTGPSEPEPTATVDDVLGGDSAEVAASLGISEQELRGLDRDKISEMLKILQGGLIFHFERFRGNGRTCATCHRGAAFDLKPEDVQELHARRPNDPLFLHDGSDDGLGNGTTRIQQNATIRVDFNLPANVTIVENPSLRQVTLMRAVPSLLNVPALETIFMLDGRQPTLQAQALGAVNDHAQAERQPTAGELDAIAIFQEKDPHFFSSPVLREFANGGPAPVLPEGNTDSERRGRAFFEPDTACGSCHGGPMLNETTAGNIGTKLGFGNGVRVRNIRVPIDNVAGLPQWTYRCVSPTGAVTTSKTADPGLVLTNGNCGDMNHFRISTLWGINESAPYFHNNSAKTLEEVMDQYDRFFNILVTARGLDIRLTREQRADILAYMRLL
ncbi:MAG: hypothetical protein ACAI38_03250 [Myxococcota bacterium]